MSTEVSAVPPEELMTLVQRVFTQFRELQEQVERLTAAAGDRQRSGPVVTPPAEPPPPGSPTVLTKTLESLASQAHDSVRGVLQGGAASVITCRRSTSSVRMSGGTSWTRP